MRTTTSVTISLPPKQLKTAERLAKKQSRTMSELFREALRRYEQEESMPDPRALSDLAKAVRLIRDSAREAGLDKMTKREINGEIETVRKQRGAQTRKPANRAGK